MPLPTSPYPVALIEFEGQAVYSYDVRSLDLETNVGFLADALTLVLDNSRLLSNFIRKEQAVEVWLGYVGDPHLWDKSELTHVFSGAVDGVAPSFGTDRTLTVRCRDHTRLLIDSQADPGWSYASLADAGIVTLLAKQAGLTPQVSPSLVPISEEEQQAFLGGGYIGNPEVGMSGWEIVQTLAVRNGYVAYVTPDKVLYWGPRGAGLRGVPIVGGVLDAAASLGVWTYLEQPFDLLGVTFDDSALIVNKVTVVRWLGLDQVQPDGFVSGFAVDEGRIAAARGRVIEKTVASTTANSTQECEAEARALLETLTRPAITAQATVQGDPRLVGDAKLTLAGRALGRLAGDYYIEAARHHLGTDGYRAELQLSSVRPEASEVYRSALNVNQEDAEQAQADTAAAAGAGMGTSACRQKWVVNFGFRAKYSSPGFMCAGRPGEGLHRGHDLIIEGKPNQGRGTPVGAFQPGTVEAVTLDSKGGNGVIIRMENGLYSRYFHWDSIAVSAGQKVAKCDVLGVLGASGTEGNPHLHFEVSHGINGDCPPTIDPTPYYQDSIGDPDAAVVTGAGPGAITPAAYPLRSAPAGLVNSAPARLRAAITKRWPRSEWDNAAAISFNETGGSWKEDAHKDDAIEDSRGVFQVNVRPNANPQFAGWDLFDYETCALAAYEIWSGSGNSWRAWSTAPGLGLA
jgi:murein DD-endopeptidase MepM/ murein hydrolase activator NlpD